MIGNDTNEIIQELFDSFLHKYQIGLEQSMIGSNFIFDYVSGLHSIRNKINTNRSGSNKDSLKWIKKKQQ